MSRAQAPVYRVIDEDELLGRVEDTERAPWPVASPDRARRLLPAVGSAIAALVIVLVLLLHGGAAPPHHMVSRVYAAGNPATSPGRHIPTAARERATPVRREASRHPSAEPHQHVQAAALSAGRNAAESPAPVPSPATTARAWPTTPESAPSPSPASEFGFER